MTLQFIAITHPDGRSARVLPASLEVWRARGWVPASEAPEPVDHLDLDEPPAPTET